jgi:4a-hydroxytetrahydrobiopterin dehydratase
MQKLKEQEIENLLLNLEGWEVKDDSLVKDYGFKGFSTAMRFVNSLAPVAEKINHFPTIINSYNRVTISLISHDAKGLTKLDFKFAEQSDEIADELRK